MNNSLLGFSEVAGKAVWTIYNRRCQRRLMKMGYLEFLKKRPANAVTQPYCDLWHLYKLIRTRKPKVVLEFGRGVLNRDHELRVER